MPLLSYQTTVNSEKTAQQVIDKLRKAGASQILTLFDDDQKTSGIRFRIKTAHGEKSFELPVNPDAILKVLDKQNVPARYCNLDQARRIAWRIILTWVQGQLALIETEMVTFDQVFLPYLMWNGQTLYEQLVESQFQALSAPTSTAKALPAPK